MQVLQMTFTLSQTFNLMVSQDTKPLPGNIKVITNLAEPKIIDELCHFLRLTRKFISLFTNIMNPLNKLLRKDTKFQWSTQCQPALEHLKNALCKKPILQYPDVSKPYTFFTDATSMLILALHSGS